MGIGWLLTERGTPKMFYGTEVLLKGISNPDGLVRGDLPGGWKEDHQDKFIAAGRTEKENEISNRTKTIANYRKHSSALKTGKLVQYVPQRDVYTYFLQNGGETVMIVMNMSKEDRKIEPDRFAENTKGFPEAVSISNGAAYALSTSWNVPAKPF